jgi:hypothetical protein
MAITVDEFVLFCERTIDGMVAALERLDDTTVNALPPLPAPNSAFQLVTHALGACEWWTAHVVCGRPSARDRAAEFTSAGTVAELRERATAATARLRALEPELAVATRLAFPAHTQTPLGREWTVGAALLHTYEELAQHLGHLEITVDLVAG